MGLTDSTTWHGVYTSMVPPPDDAWYTPLGMHPVQSTSSMDHGTWVPSSTPHPDFMLFPHSPPFVPATSDSTSQPMFHSTPSTSTNSSDYVWVPQRPYALTAHHFVPTQPIEFNVHSGEPGIRLSAALNRKFSQLKDRDDLVFKSNKRSPTITMRLEVCGFL